VSSLVTELRALELIYEKAAHPELAYMFKHALTHDVAYESILHQHRRELHRMIGTAIEELYDDRLAEHYETLAHHFARAEDLPRAFEYHTRAATKALARSRATLSSSTAGKRCASRTAPASTRRRSAGSRSRRCSAPRRSTRAHFSTRARRTSAPDGGAGARR
jgi:hypothetical protein